MIYFICLASPTQRKIHIRDSYKGKRSRVSLPIFCLNFDMYTELSNLISIDRQKVFTSTSRLHNVWFTATLTAMRHAPDDLKIVAVHTKLC